MKIRIRFSKKGTLKFVGHLDIMRFFQRVLRRAGVKMRYSEGFNPHPVMSFAAPLGVGLTSDGEYVDIDVLESASSKEMIRRINEVLTDEMRILSFRLLPDKLPKAMAQVAAADYTVKFYENRKPENPAAFIEGTAAFLQRESIPVQKQTKSGAKTADIRPMIYTFSTDDNMTVKMKIAAGSESNLKPEALMEAYMESLHLPLKPVSLLINRDELYAKGPDDTDKTRHFLSLESFGKDIREDIP